MSSFTKLLASDSLPKVLVYIFLYTSRTTMIILFLWFVLVIAFLLQSIEYLRCVAGCRTVPVEVGSRYTDEDWSQTLLTLNEFIDKYIVNKVSVSSFQAVILILIWFLTVLIWFSGPDLSKWRESFGLSCSAPTFWSGTVFVYFCYYVFQKKNK